MQKCTKLNAHGASTSVRRCLRQAESSLTKQLLNFTIGKNLFVLISSDSTYELSNQSLGKINGNILFEKIREEMSVRSLYSKIGCYPVIILCVKIAQHKEDTFRDILHRTLYWIGRCNGRSLLRVSTVSSLMSPLIRSLNLLRSLKYMRKGAMENDV